MHQVGSAHDSTAERFANRLIPQTHAEYRNLAGKGSDRVDSYPRIARNAWAWRDNYPLWSQFPDLINRYSVIPIDHWLSAEFAKILDKVVGKRIVIIDD